MLELFPKDQKVGVFRGYREGGMEFHADLAIPYKVQLRNIPMHGQFLLVQLENPSEAALGRIISMRAEGRLASDAGEQYTIRAMDEERTVPDDLREDFLRYRVDIRVLGVLRIEGEQLHFAPSHRRLPHVGSPVAFLSDEVLKRVVAFCKENPVGADIGFFALGEYLYSADDERIEVLPWMQVRSPRALVKFDVKHLVSRRTFVFARAGYGKSNLNKLLFSALYETPPTVKRGGRDVPVGTVIFDPDGEYFWPDDDGNPGLCDVPELKDRLVIFTERQAPSAYYGSFIVGKVRLDIRRLNPSDVISIALSPDRQDQQNVRKLRSLNQADWGRLVDLIDRDGNNADISEIEQILHLEADRQQAEAFAARANMTSIVRMLHDRASQMLDSLMRALSEGKLCIVDISQLRGGPSLILSGLILRRIFDHNQEQFTRADSKSIPTIAVVEEAQSVLNDKGSASSPYIEWVKEGRKYGLGAVLITQQPGSIPNEILSQGDNWFIFHLLSSSDLANVKSANAHFSQDLLSSLLNEPIAGQGVFWSGVSDAPFPISMRVMSFRKKYKVIDPKRSAPAVETYAASLRSEMSRTLLDMTKTEGAGEERGAVDDADHRAAEDSEVDMYGLARRQAILKLKDNKEFWQAFGDQGVAWGAVKAWLLEALPNTLHDRDTVAYSLVKDAMEVLVGKQDITWTTVRRPSKRGGKVTTYILKNR